jgi:hypothetical protein
LSIALISSVAGPAIAQATDNSAAYVSELRSATLLQKETALIMEMSDNADVRLYAMRQLETSARNFHMAALVGHSGGLTVGPAHLSDGDQATLNGLKSLHGAEQLKAYFEIERSLVKRNLALVARYSAPGIDQKLDSLARRNAEIANHRLTALRSIAAVEAANDAEVAAIVPGQH